jgi:catechol 2,3-dioxygenase-like lactoylglutathione lyase family enzyme
MTDANASGVGRAGLLFDHAIPILRVADYDRSLAYYVDRLGFKHDWSDARFGSVSRGRTSLMLSVGSQGCTSTWVWIGVGDADALYEELLEPWLDEQGVLWLPKPGGTWRRVEGE